MPAELFPVHLTDAQIELAVDILGSEFRSCVAGTADKKLSKSRRALLASQATHVFDLIKAISPSTASQLAQELAYVTPPTARETAETFKHKS